MANLETVCLFTDVIDEHVCVSQVGVTMGSEEPGSKSGKLTGDAMKDSATVVTVTNGDACGHNLFALLLEACQEGVDIPPFTQHISRKLSLRLFWAYVLFALYSAQSLSQHVLALLQWLSLRVVMLGRHWHRR